MSTILQDVCYIPGKLDQLLPSSGFSRPHLPVVLLLRRDPGQGRAGMLSDPALSTLSLLQPQ